MMKILLILILAIVAFAACSKSEMTNETVKRETASAISQVDARDAEKAVAETDVQFVDVRTPEEYSGGHAEKALNMPLDTFKESLVKLDVNKPVYVICQTGRRSQKAAEMLNDAGFKNIYNITGGTSAWQADKLPMEQ